MKQYNNLLHSIAEELGIMQGNQESQERWKARTAYSILGRMAYASLFDSYEEFQEDMQNEEPVSVTHFKHRIQHIFSSYLEMYPEISLSISMTGEDFSDNIYDIFLKTGCIYHEPFRICASAPCCAIKGLIRFERGMPLSRHQYTSGLGTYTEVEKIPAFAGCLSPLISDMFALPSDTLLKQWDALISAAQWQRLEDTNGMRYLRENPPFQSGYWLNRPDIHSDEISVCRSGQPGNYIFYLYRIVNKKFMTSPLPALFAIDPHFGPITYRIANCSLAAHHRLPAIKYQRDGEIVKLFLQYILPLPELYFLRLYSWPLEFSKTSNHFQNDFPSDFRRIVSAPVFEAIKSILEAIGYTFAEV